MNREMVKVAAANSEVIVMNPAKNLNYQLMVILRRWCLNIGTNGTQVCSDFLRI
jgi:hypothetical protein